MSGGSGNEQAMPSSNRRALHAATPASSMSSTAARLAAAPGTRSNSMPTLASAARRSTIPAQVFFAALAGLPIRRVNDTSGCTSQTAHGAPGNHRSTSRTFAASAYDCRLIPKPVSCDDRTVALAWLGASRAARGAVKNTALRRGPRMTLASMSARRREASGNPIGMSMAIVRASGIAAASTSITGR